MKVLVTGAFGNIGRNAVAQLLKRGHRVRCFDLCSKANEKLSRRLAGKVECVWGDLRNLEDVERAVLGQDIVIHFAFVIPKMSTTGIDCEDQPDWAEAVNVGGTKNLLKALETSCMQTKIIFSSSMHVHGITTGREPPLRVDDPLKPVEHYSLHKVACERMITASCLPWAVFRFAAALPFSLKLDHTMFEIPLDNRMEFVHHRDVGLALAKAVDSKDIWGKVLNIGGGAACRLMYRDIVETLLRALGIGMLPENAFGTRPFSTDWLDTEESQRLLQYQGHVLQDYVQDFRRRLGIRRLLIRLLRPVVRCLLLRKSPYYAEGRLKAAQKLSGKTALLTSAANSFGEAIARKLAEKGLNLLILEKPGEVLDALVYQIREEGGEVRVLRADLSRERDLGQVLQQNRLSKAGVDFLINQPDPAGISGNEEHVISPGFLANIGALPARSDPIDRGNSYRHESSGIGTDCLCGTGNMFPPGRAAGFGARRKSFFPGLCPPDRDGSPRFRS